MAHTCALAVLAVLVVNVSTAPQFITVKDGKLGVNFGGYHAAVGLGGLAGGSNAGGGLFAEAGTPFGQHAGAGLGGGVGHNGKAAGGLYAGATAGGNVRASAGLAGGVSDNSAAGNGFANAQAGNRFASSSLAGESGVAGDSGVTVQKSKTVGVQSVSPVIKDNSLNELNAIPLSDRVSSGESVDKDLDVIKGQTVIEKEVSKLWPYHNVNYQFHSFSPYSPIEVRTPTWRSQFSRRHYYSYDQPQVEVPTVPVVAKEVVKTYYKPRHHFRKTAYFNVGNPFIAPPPGPVVYKTYEPAVHQKYVGFQAAAQPIDAVSQGSSNVGLASEVSYQTNPTFFADIFNIPISALRAVGDFLGNAAGGTKVSVHKAASIQAASDLTTSKHAPELSSSSSDSSSKISIETPPVTKIIDDIFSIPINTLGAVNKFLENNVQRKKVQVTEGGEEVPAKVRLGPHARRRANNKRVILLEKDVQEKSD